MPIESGVRAHASPGAPRTRSRRCPLVLLLLMAAAAAAQGPPPTQEHRAPLPLEVGLFSSSDFRTEYDYMRREIGTFQAAHPEIELRPLSVTDPKSTELMVTDLPGLPRNVVGFSNVAGCGAAYLALRDELVPIDTFLPDPELSPDDFHANLLEPVRYGGKLWALPWATQPRLLVCDWDLFEAAGVEAPPATWEELRALAERFTADTDSDGKTDQYGFMVRSRRELGYLVITMVLQKGRAFLTESGINGSEPALREAADFLLQMKEAGCAVLGRDRDIGDPEFRLAMMVEDVNSAWLFASGQVNKERRYRVAFLPTWGRPVQMNFSTLYMAVRKSTPEEEAASWQFVKWISRPGVELPRVLTVRDPEGPKNNWIGGPCRRDFADRPDFRGIGLAPETEFWKLCTVNATLEDYGPNDLLGRWDAVNLFVTHFLGEVMVGRMSLDEALRKGPEEANRHVRRIQAPAWTSYALYR